MSEEQTIIMKDTSKKVKNHIIISVLLIVLAVVLLVSSIFRSWLFEVSIGIGVLGIFWYLYAKFIGWYKYG